MANVATAAMAIALCGMLWQLMGPMWQVPTCRLQVSTAWTFARDEAVRHVEYSTGYSTMGSNSKTRCTKIDFIPQSVPNPAGGITTFPRPSRRLNYVYPRVFLPCDAMRCTVFVIVIRSVCPSVCPSVCLSVTLVDCVTWFDLRS